MREQIKKVVVSIQTKMSMTKEKCQNYFQDEGSFLTEHLGVVAITVALIALVLIGFTAIIGDTTTSTSVLGMLNTKITEFFGS